MEGIGNNEYVPQKPLFITEYLEGTLSSVKQEPVKSEVVVDAPMIDGNDTEGSYLTPACLAKQPATETIASPQDDSRDLYYKDLLAIYTAPNPMEALRGSKNNIASRLNEVSQNATRKTIFNFAYDRFLSLKDSLRGIRESKLYRKKAALMTIGALALASCGSSSNSLTPTNKKSSQSVAVNNNANCNSLSVTNKQPANYNQGAFFPTNKADNAQSAANIYLSWFNKGPLGDHAVAASLAIQQATIGDLANNANGVITQPNYNANFSQALNRIKADTSVPNKTAAGYCIELSRFMGETESYSNKFAVKGDRVLWLQSVTNKRGDITGVNPVEVVWGKNYNLSGIVFSPPSNAATLGISGFPAEVVTNSGQVYIEESSLPTGGANNKTTQTGQSGNRVAPKNNPVGSSGGKNVANNAPGVGKHAGGNRSEPTPNKITGVGPSKGGEQSSPTNVPAPGKGPSQGGNIPTATTEGPAPTPTPTTPPETVPPTTTTPPETVPPTTTTTTTPPPSSTTTTVPPTTTTTILKPGDPGATANNNSGTGQSDPFNAGGSSDYNNLGTTTLAQ